MKLREHYKVLLNDIDELAAKLECQREKARLVFSEQETVAAAYNALNRACRERDALHALVEEGAELCAYEEDPASQDVLADFRQRCKATLKGTS